MQILRPVALLGLASVLACASPGHPGPYHSVLMRGQVVDSSGKDVYVCIGAQDGARPGQRLRVYRITKQRHTSFSRETVGTIRIDSIVDEHFAKGTIVAGTATTNNMVELESD